MREPHPTAMILDLENGAGTAEQPWTVAYDYFNHDPLVWDENATYTDGEPNFTHTTVYEWDHSLSDVVTALIGAGLAIEGLYEYPDADWPASPNLERNENGGWQPADSAMSIPLTFAVVARKPG